jgi:hypothetical protein
MATIILLILMPTFLAVVIVLPSRIRMERRARALLAKFPNPERTSVNLPFESGWFGGKRMEMETKISDMKAEGWTFLRATEAAPWRTLCSWGGGVNLHFIREDFRAQGKQSCSEEVARDEEKG